LAVWIADLAAGWNLSGTGWQLRVLIGRTIVTKTHAENLMVPHVTTASPNGSTVCAQSFLDAFPSTGSWSCWGSTDTLPTKKPDANSIVFIIDDDAQVRSNLMNLCRSVELNVKVFSSPNEFLNTPRPDHSACVVLEVLFPGSAPHGLEFQRPLVSMNDFLPIIFLTGHGDIRISVKAIKGGALDFLTKPACEQDLLHAIRKGIDRDRERRKKEQAISSLRKRYDSLSTREREIDWVGY